MRKFSPSLYCKCGNPISDDRAKMSLPYQESLCFACERSLRSVYGEYDEILRELNEKIEP